MDAQKCAQLYGDGDVANQSSAPGWYTFAIIVLTVSLECFANCKLGSMDTEQQKPDEEAATRPAGSTSSISSEPQAHPQPQVELQPQTAGQASKATETAEQSSDSDSLCIENASPQIRANRFALATLLYGITIIPLIALIRHEQNRTIDPDCLPFMSPPPPDLASIILSSIAFTCATFAFLRTLVDCVLLRWKTALVYDVEKHKGPLWLPAMPIIVVLGMAFVIGLGVFECVKVPVAWWTGDGNVSWFTAKDKGKAKAQEEGVEMRDEERQGLVENIDGLHDEDGDSADGLPAYDEVCTENVASHGNIGKEVLS